MPENLNLAPTPRRSTCFEKRYYLGFVITRPSNGTDPSDGVENMLRTVQKCDMAFFPLLIGEDFPSLLFQTNNAYVLSASLRLPQR